MRCGSRLLDVLIVPAAKEMATMLRKEISKQMSQMREQLNRMDERLNMILERLP